MFIYESINSISFIPGPKKIDWISDSQSINNIAQYNINEVFSLFCEILKPETVKSETHDPYNWILRKTWKKEFMQLTFSVFEDPIESIWGGSMIECKCSFDKIFGIWLNMRKRYDSIWIHDSECNIYNIDSFINVFVTSQINDSQILDEELIRIRESEKFS